MFTWLVHLSWNLSHIFAKGTCGGAERVDLSTYLQLVRLIWNHTQKKRQEYNPFATFQSDFDQYDLYNDTLGLENTQLHV